jgi:hypothetical protein
VIHARFERGVKPKGWSVIAGVAVALTVAVFVIFQGFGLFAGSSANGPRPDTLSQALQSASSTLSYAPGGPWSLTSAVGVAYTVSWTLDASHLANQCSTISGTFANATYPAGSGNYSQGQADIWVLSFAGPAASSGILWIAVGYGTATEIGVVSVSSQCSQYSGPPLGTVLDSSVAMEKVLATTNGSRFAEMFSRANVTYVLGPGSPPLWTIHLSPCGPIVAGPGVLTSSVSASNGTIQTLPRAPTAC